MDALPQRFGIADLRHRYTAGTATPDSVLAEIRARANTHRRHNAWIHPPGDMQPGTHLQQPDDAPFAGVPFAIKDNIDLAGVPTTAGCPAFAYTPARSATVVERLLAAGAVPVGKANMDQFATGLVGTRSPYGVARNAIDPALIAGGSSSGSALAVAHGMASFALGTDTAGSGRVPAAFNELVGFKPTRGWWPTRGVVPACRSLDCVSVFTNNVADARAVAQVACGYDSEDPYSRRIDRKGFDAGQPRFGAWPPDQLCFRGDAQYRRLYADYVGGLGGSVASVDPKPFLAAGAMLYDGPWLAERYATLGAFLAANGDRMHPVTRAVIEAGRGIDAADAFLAMHRLAALKRTVEQAFADIDILVAPTAPTIYTVEQVEADPLDTNANLGAFTNFVNLLDLCAVALPAGRTAAGAPFGVTLMAEAGRDHALLDAAESISV